MSALYVLFFDIHVYIFTHKYIHECQNLSADIHTCTPHIHTHTYQNVKRSPQKSHIRVKACCMHACVGALQINADTDSHTHTYTHTNTHTYTHTPECQTLSAEEPYQSEGLLHASLYIHTHTHTHIHTYTHQNVKRSPQRSHIRVKACCMQAFVGALQVNADTDAHKFVLTVKIQPRMKSLGGWIE